jgi:hypothetical protein
LIVPRIVLTEFQRNKSRIIQESCRSLSSVFKRVKEVIGKFGDPKRKRVTLDLLNDVDHKIPQLGESVIDSVTTIEALLTSACIIETTDDIMLRAAQRGVDKKAPFHRQRNGMDDSILIEAYAEALRKETSRGTRFAFVTHNVKDFSAPDGDDRTPHPDLLQYFSKIKSLYFIRLRDAVQRIAPRDVLSDLLFEFDQEHMDEPRSLTEILQAENELTDKIWYDRHQLRRHMIKEGRIKLVNEERNSVSPHTILRRIWKGALASARKVERRYGKKNLGPYTEFEWGMLSGKLSALRWVLGMDWDILDT